MSKPSWLRVRSSDTENRRAVEEILRGLNLNTVCAAANCPNYFECFSKKTATFMILGTQCTRNCRFCNVTNGTPDHPNADEPANIANAIKELGLAYAVVTSVTRDDLPDGGAAHFAETIRSINRISPETAVEVLIPDLRGDIDSLKVIASADPTVISHNMETIRRLYAAVRPAADYHRSLKVLGQIRQLNPSIRAKSGFMVGLGETKEEVRELLADLRSAGVEFVTIGQYLAPTKEHIPVHEYITPEQFAEYGSMAKEMGFEFVASAPLVRSSYMAHEALETLEGTEK